QTTPLTADSGSLVVGNIAPTANVSGPTTGNVGDTFSFTLSAADPSTADTTAGFSYTVHWNDGTPDTTVSLTAGDVTVTHAFTLPGDHTFTVTAADQDSNVSNPASHTVDVSGAAVINGVLTVVGADANDAIFFGPNLTAGASHARIR